LLHDGSLILSIDEALRHYASEWMPSLPETLETAHPQGQSIRISSASLDRPLDPRYEHHTALVQKYERAALYPFLPVAADPPEPGWP